MGTHPIGAITYVVATGWAEVISNNTPMRMVVKPHAGPGVFLPKLNSGELDMAVDVSSGLHRAWVGEAEWEGKRQTNIRSLWLNRWQRDSIVAAVRRDSNIKSIEDLKGARVASDYGGNVNVIRYFTVAFSDVGMTWDDVIQVPVSSFKVGWDALREGRVDATYGMGLKVPFLQEAHAAIGVRAIGYPRNPEEIPEFPKLLPGMKGVHLTPEKFDVLEHEIWGNAMPFWYLASTHLSEEAAYQLTKTAWENYEKIMPVHPHMKAFKPEQMVEEQWAPYHDGAVRWYKEKGVWTDELEQKQKKLLGL